MTVEEVAAAISAAMERPNPVLFAGAGVGCRVDLPTWTGFIEHLASVCDSWHDKTSATLIRERLGKEQFLSAAAVFKSCENIPSGERLKAMAAPFIRTISPDTIDRLCPLVALGFTAIVTTNYDTSMHEARAQAGKGWVLPKELDDRSLAGASLSTAFFLARIHGRAQKPQSMVLDRDDYKRVLEDQAYLDFLLDILKSRSCLFVGFSFLDPAIDQVLNIYKERVGPQFEAPHTALVPEGAESLIARLGAVNIATIEYNPADSHRDLWRAIRIVFDERDQDKRTRSAVVTPTLTIPAVHQYMAFAYAQMQTTGKQQPIAALVQDGIVLSSLPSVGVGALVPELVEKVRQILRLSPEEATGVVDGSLQRLVTKEQAVRLGDRFIRKGGSSNVLEDHLRLLVGHVVDRIRVRSGIRAGAEDEPIIRNALEAVFVWRAWDVAAHFAGSGTRLSTDLSVAVGRAVEDNSRGRKAAIAAIKDGIVDLLTAPEDRETPILAEIGRAAFGLQLVLATPRQALFRKHALPETIYLDTNVLMPAITAGHPLQPIYREAIDKLIDAGRRSGLMSKVVVGRQFLNEIVSHRRLAVRIASEMSLDDPKRLQQHILFYSAAPSNVFIGGYAGWIGHNERRHVTFDSYLRQVAPFEDEEQLSAFLAIRGITTTDMRFVGDHGGRYAELLGRVLGGYEADTHWIAKSKEKLLIEHEAQQLTQLYVDIQAGHRSLFVSSDAHLRRLIQRDDELKPLGATIISHLGLVALVDVMVGLEGDTRSLTRLIWATPHVDQERALFDYFVNIAMRNYREGVAMEMQVAAERVAQEMKASADEDQLHLFGRGATEIAATTKLLDRYEDKFFEYWREAIDRRTGPSEPS